MKLNKAYEFLCLAKGLAIMALILILFGWVVYGYSYTMEVEYTGPGSEYERSMERYRDESNREGCERCGSDRERPGDREKSENYRKDHGA